MRTMRILAAIAVIATGLGVNDAMAQDPLQLLHDVQVDADRTHRLAATASMRIRAIDARVATMEAADPADLRRIVTSYSPALRQLKAAIDVLPEDTTLPEWVTQVTETTAKVECIEAKLDAYIVGSLLVLGDHEIRLVGLEEAMVEVQETNDRQDDDIDSLWEAFSVRLGAGGSLTAYNEVEGIRSDSAKGVRLSASIGWTGRTGSYAGLYFLDDLVFQKPDAANIWRVGVEGGPAIGPNGGVLGFGFGVGAAEYDKLNRRTGYASSLIGPMLTPYAFYQQNLDPEGRFAFRADIGYTAVSWGTRVTSHTDTTRIPDAVTGITAGATVTYRFGLGKKKSSEDVESDD